MAEEERPARSVLCIAGFEFLIDVVHRSASCGADDFIYREFRKPTIGCEGAVVNLSINIMTGPPPDPPDVKPLFSNESWRMFKTGGGRLVEFPGAGDIGSLWTVKWDDVISDILLWPGVRANEYAKRRSFGSDLLRYPLDQLLMMYALAGRGGFIAHAAAVIAGDGGYIFAGVSGAGKSTISSLIARNCPEATILSDDRAIVRKIGGRFCVFGSPWAGTAGLAENRGAPLKGILLLEQANENRVKKQPGAQALPGLVKTVSVPWYDKDVAPSILDTLGAAIESVPAGVFHFKRDRGAFDEFMNFTESK